VFKPVKLGYRIFRFCGDGTPPKTPIVLLRGLGRSSGFWLEFAPMLSKHADVVCVDLLGTGLSPSPWGRGRIQQLAKDVSHTLDDLGYSALFLVGISLGGMVALEVARLSQAVRKVAVLASSSRGGGPRIRPRALAQLLWSLRKGTPSNAELASFLVSSKTLHHRPDLPAIWDRLWESEGFATLPVIRQLLAAALYDARPVLADLNKPTLFMVSKDDALVPWQRTVDMWEAMRSQKRKLVTLEEFGHDFPTEAPQVVIEHLVDFFHGHDEN